MFMQNQKKVPLEYRASLYWTPTGDNREEYLRFAKDHPEYKESGRLYEAWRDWVEKEKARQRAEQENEKQHMHDFARNVIPEPVLQELFVLRRRLAQREQEIAHLRQQLIQKQTPETNVQVVACAPNDNANLRKILGVNPAN